MTRVAVSTIVSYKPSGLCKRCPIRIAQMHNQKAAVITKSCSKTCSKMEVVLQLLKGRLSYQDQRVE